MRQIPLLIVLALLTCLMPVGTVLAQNGHWSPAEGPLTTQWTSKVDPNNVLPEYPRPQLIRDRWASLNGLWDYTIVRRGTRPDAFNAGKILVPFPVESMLSGVGRTVGEANTVWYKRDFDIPKDWAGQNLMLHFGAVDWETRVWIDGKQVGSHYGGYDPFSFDITDAIDKSKNKHEIIVAVWDPTSEGGQAIGKQHTRPHGIWYTSVTGIWQTVWIEPVPSRHIASLKITPDVDHSQLRLTVHGKNLAGLEAVATVLTEEDGETISTHRLPVNREGAIKIESPQLWSPNDPHLYGLKVELVRGDEIVDRVDSYFAMRSTTIGPDSRGVQRLLLNGEPIFHYGPLDQGWWPDGLYTPPTEEAMVFDIQFAMDCGFNMIRKHVKVEPARWYYHCDKMGVLVWQDMPNMLAGREPTSQDREQYELELRRMIDHLHNHPSIVMWVPFNEGWGQYDTVRVTNWTKAYDPSRIVNNASGWHDRGAGDVHDVHIYPGPGMPTLERERAAVLGEFGGLGLPVINHIWQDRDNWGYRSYENKEDLLTAYSDLVRNMEPLIGLGLSAAVYTQTTDVEIEVNGLLTYDRRQVKLAPEQLRKIHAPLYTAAERFGSIQNIVETSEKEPQTWSYTFTQPANGWQNTDFNDTQWAKGPGGFGTKETPNTTVRTVWAGSDIWVRRSFDAKDTKGKRIGLWIHHDEDVKVYLNGQLIYEGSGWTTAYTPIFLPAAAAASLKDGKNTLAIHCHQNTGGQYIDVGVFTVDEE